ncbi:hypothetical protein BUALT_Bualt09G0094400 [Buddleja alternifolia]|uniref:Retrotransposon gag domain-containing protein n=1 Tax=Buddleja alternifolia TaxID=168488 RepID=A0AAV6X8I0_9LAMI|nr:hypothetical protein BUALT_Bualt09G0094400 [Buddleja alternifolia]
MYSDRQLSSWDAFVRALEVRFGPSSYDNHQAALFKLRQTSSVSDYQAHFEQICNRVVGLPPEAILNCFVSGLRVDIQLKEQTTKKKKIRAVASSEMNPGLTAEAAAQLREGINLVLYRWAALRMAIENEWGGRDSHLKSEQLGHLLFHRLTQSKEQVYMDDIEDMLDEFMLSLNTEIGDGSDEEIAEKLMVMREECLEGNFDSIKKLKETNAPSVSYSRQPGSNDEDGSDGDGDDDDDESMGEDNSSGMEVDAPQHQSNLNQKGTRTNEPGPEEVADGWTVVAPRRSKGRRN